MEMRVKNMVIMVLRLLLQMLKSTFWGKSKPLYRKKNPKILIQF